ncbi:MAG: sigma-70 family RNA polymerase sigma factor [Saprospiraceae bacterium]|nr:sigma-70 family RNA polymerase sigma factor [Bacteroidia bacterium]NNE14993.1 sigma-70 family RNA polymerase sigma factor [Saprospiraceae bacterium]NNL93372.1 sigma-70 family RNA polymerase sigma factor [Saprospiraceae bacterium]
MSAEEFKIFVQNLKDKMYRVAFRVVNNHEEARDVVQDALVKIWNKRALLEGVENKDAYCITITRNMGIDKLRSRKMQTSDISERYDLESKAANPERIAVAKDEFARIKAFINTMADNHKEVLLLRDVDGYSYKEISGITGYSIEKVKVYLHRARMKIKQHFKTKVS